MPGIKGCKILQQESLLLVMDRHHRKTHWGRLLARIKSCPASGGNLDDALGRRVVCYCGYHVVIFIFLQEFRIQLFHKLYFKSHGTD